MKRIFRFICCILVFSLLLAPMALADFETPPDYIGDDDAWVNPFTDVKTSMWSYSSIAFVSQRGLVSGMTPTTFGPKVTTSRAMLVNILWRYDGSKTGFSHKFVDVSAGKWFADAVAWAAANGIVSGVDATHFNPNGLITREQMALIFQKFAIYRHIDVSASASLDSFPDAKKVGAWALPAMKWAVAKGLISGTTKNGQLIIDPRGNATREQVASILMRYIQNIMEE